MKIKVQSSLGNVYCYDNHTNSILKWTHSQGNSISKIPIYEKKNEFNCMGISSYTIEITQKCNLRCSYCCYSGNYIDRHRHNENVITQDTAKDVVSFIKHHHTPDAGLLIVFYGGEALLARERVEWFINTIRQQITDVTGISFSLSSNGLLLTKETVDWICTIPNLLVNVTIDGAKEDHDRNRKTSSGMGSFDVVMQNLHLFKKNHEKEFFKRVNFLSTVYHRSELRKLSNFWEGNDLLRSKRPVHISFVIPNFKDKNRIYDSFSDKIKFYSFALESMEKGEDNCMTDALKGLFAIIESRIHNELSEKMCLNTCLNDMHRCFINTDGYIYACEKFCDSFSIGHISTGFDSNKIQEIQEKYLKRKNLYCSHCWANRLCRVCLTCLNFDIEEMPLLCKMEKDTLMAALKTFIDKKEFDAVKNITKKKNY